MAATTVLKTPPTFSTAAAYLCSTAAGGSSVKPPRISLTSNRIPLPVIRCRIYNSTHRRSSVKFPGQSSVRKFLSCAANGETAEAQTETQEKEQGEGSDSEPEIEVVFFFELLPCSGFGFFFLGSLVPNFCCG